MSNPIEDIKTGFEEIKTKAENSGFVKWVKKSGAGVIGIIGGIIAVIIIVSVIIRLLAGPCAVGGTVKDAGRYFKQCEMRIRLQAVKDLGGKDMVEDDPELMWRFLRYIATEATDQKEADEIKAEEAQKKKGWFK